MGVKKSLDQADMFLANLEYLSLRLVRKFFFTDAALSSVGRFIPHYRVNQGQLSPGPIVDEYWRHCHRAGLCPAGRKILEVGVGSTNSTGYEIIARGGAQYWAYEPYRALNHPLDRTLLQRIGAAHGVRTEELKGRVKRLQNLGDLPSASVDIVFSSSVLEHVASMRDLLLELGRTLKGDGVMIHLIDYRDHFFKYPFHFLKYDETTWNRFLNPGDLPRRRLPDHLRELSTAGFTVEILHKEYQPEAFQEIKPYLNEAFRREDGDIDVTQAVLLVRHSNGSTQESRSGCDSRFRIQGPTQTIGL